MAAFDELKKIISESPKSFVVVLGAGASIPAGLPSWTELKQLLCDKARDIYDDPDEYDRQMQVVNSARDLWTCFSRLRTCLGRQAYEKAITQALDVSHREIPNLYQQIWKLNVAGVVDFNLDKFAINAYSHIHKEVVDFATGREPHKYKNFPLSYSNFVFFPHGIVSDTSSWVFTPNDRRELYENSDFKALMCALFNSKNLLIIGFNVEEWSFLNLLSNIGIDNKVNGFHNYYLAPNASSEMIKELGEYVVVLCVDRKKPVT